MKTPLQRIRTGAIALLVVVFASIVVFRFLGNYSWLEATWLVVITISTVGFSENSSLSAPMQAFTILVILFGVSSAVYACGGFIQLVLEGEVERVLGKIRMTKEISKLENHVIICGFGRLGQDLATQLRHRSITYVVIDNDPTRTALAAEQGAPVITGDATTDKVLNEANVEKAKSLVSALPADAENVFIALTARNLHSGIQIIAKSEQESSCRKLRQAGADKIVMPHRVGAQQMERMISRPTTADLVELFAEASHLEMELDEFRVGGHSSLVGATLGESEIRDEFNMLVVGIKNADGEIRFNPTNNELIHVEDTLLVIGQVDDINRMKDAHQL